MHSTGSTRSTPVSHLACALIALATALGCGPRGGASSEVSDTATDGDASDAPGDTRDDDEDLVAVEDECTEDGECEDGDPCTTDSCDTDLGVCVQEPVDGDEDGFAAMAVDGAACEGGTDCADDDEAVYPGAPPDCTGTVDRDCDGANDPDEDEDGYESEACGGDDCDDADPSAFPGSIALDCTLDRDCNGHLDSDNDADGHDSPGCGGDDCDDALGSVHPEAAEINCNGRDDDCNGEMSTVEDRDQDGYANESCAAVGKDSDCDDDDENIYPGAATTCDAVDDDCSGSWQDESGSDDDSDGHLDEACGGDDCDDTVPIIHAGAMELCPDEIDHDCDGTVGCQPWHVCGTSGHCEVPFVTLATGTFTMGSPESEPWRWPDETEHEVTLTQSFEIMATEVTQGQFEALMGYNPSFFIACGAMCPVEKVTWHEAASHANALSAYMGYSTCYTCTGSGAAVRCEPSLTHATPYDCPGYRLPTEAEWEYAARAGTTGGTYNGDTILENCESPNAVIDPIAWFCGNSLDTTHEVSMKDPNPWGLVDMLGNAWEWCHDWYALYPGDETDPWGPATGTHRIRRGCVYEHGASCQRIAVRGICDPDFAGQGFGFRLVRSLP